MVSATLVSMPFLRHDLFTELRNTMNAFNPAQFRAQFPALNDAGVYLDSAATALKPQAVSYTHLTLPTILLV